ncbi:hypothetical protein M1N06_03880 [Peptococcaceae bacterium]|nr:hypothetical protein [Peptococcaceae bacterium]
MIFYKRDATNGIAKELEVKEVGGTQTKKLSNWFPPELGTSKEMIESTSFLFQKGESLCFLQYWLLK